MADRIYLDHAATTPILPAVREAMVDAFGRWANPSSPHAEGRAARAALEDARRRIKAALDWDGAVIFTGGASDAAALALTRARRATRAVSAVEHDAILRLGKDATIIPVDASGTVKPEAIPGDALVAVQVANSETGVIQPLDDLAVTVRERGGLWLADAAQTAGKIPLPSADMLILSAHKLGGPPGIGALLIKELGSLLAIGGQEQGYRPGTENVPAAIGFAVALEQRGPRDHLASLRARIDAATRELGGVVVADANSRLPEIASYRLPGLAAAAQLIELDAAGISVSAGSACSSGSLRPSAVLTAMGWDETAAREVIRVSLAPQTTDAEVDLFLQAWRRIADRRRAA
ncbi:aminotransferase class V-fold PLP-dependent enzyme [uncultured Sphingomonas sp.]|uniref:cysteine desulfurase family protein n=1 Tax=uncultured Sphingomonas sp. TaxID=158754 RepID=UPI0025DC33D4|nr:aminotransferase class V-fold PLP-dependent enzyme [uncultured Sphingomonas sp.]